MKEHSKTAYYLDEDILIKGIKDKYGFYPDKGIQCGFDTQEIAKSDINNTIFYDINKAHKKYPNAELIEARESAKTRNRRGA